MRIIERKRIQYVRDGLRDYVQFSLHLMKIMGMTCVQTRLVKTKMQERSRYM